MGVLPRPNKMRRVMFKDDRGSILLTAMLLVFLLGLIGLSSLSQVDKEMASSSDQRASVQAFYVAEAGLERAIAQLSSDPDWAASVADQDNAFEGDNTLGTGSYTVQVFTDDPEVGSIRVQSTGSEDGFFNAATTLEVVGNAGSGSYPPILDYAHFVCGDLQFPGTAVAVQVPGDQSIIIGDVFAGGDAEMTGPGLNMVVGDMSVLGNFILSDSGNVIGDIVANGNVELGSSYDPNVNGDVQAGGNVTADPVIGVSGTTQESVLPLPVADLCEAATLAEIAITSEEIAGLKSQAGQVFSGDLTLEDETVTLTGIVVVESNLYLVGDLILSDNVVFIVDGNIHLSAPGSIESDPIAKRITLIVTEGNLEITGGARFKIDGQLQVGRIAADGDDLNGGNIQLDDDSRLVVHGSVGVLNGNLQLSDSSTLGLIWSAPQEPTLLLRGDPGQSAGFTITRWREVSN